MRVLTVGGVIAVHVVTGTNKPTSVPAGAATILLHVNREVFVLITALVLTYAYAARAHWPLRGFWARRYWLVGVPYVAWTVVYFLADGPTSGPLQAVRQLGMDLVTGNARYHLYFLLVTMQLYLVFPLLLVFVRSTRRYHLPILVASLAVQLAFTTAIHERLHPGGPLGWWLDHPDALLPSYQLYVVAGAILALRIGDLTAWVRRHGNLVMVLFAAGIVAGLASYVYDVSFRVLPPLVASEVFQPAVTVESMSVLLGLFGLGVWWADHLPTPGNPHPATAISRGPRVGPSWLVRAVRAGSDASFGIYLAHPLVLQGLLAVAGITGLLSWTLQLPGRDTLAIGLLGALPLVIAITWPAVWLARRSPLSLPFAGRQAEHTPRSRPTLAAQGIRTLALGLAVAGAVGWLDLSSVRQAAPGAASGGVTLPPPPLSAALAASAAPPAPPGTAGAVENLDVAGLVRSYQVIRPVHPVAPRLPAIVFLHGVNSDIGYEETRDGLLPLASAGQVVLVYPVGYGQSWNAGVCCGAAVLHELDDVAFLTEVEQRVAADPGVDASRISLVGYSNGGKMAYRLACDRPGLFASVAVVLALPETSCPPGPPVPLLQVAVKDDAEIPYAPGDPPFSANGVVLTPVTSEVSAWRQRDGCASGGAVRATGSLQLQQWVSCQKGSRVELATYASGGHYWPSGNATTPPAGQIVWEFVNAAS
jgi:poly(3-hydroxybutyrate) depolymerase/surface polysaccharide O-acyltransferase-like enzyme